MNAFHYNVLSGARVLMGGAVGCGEDGKGMGVLGTVSNSVGRGEVV